MSKQIEGKQPFVVPLVDEQKGERIYHPDLLRYALIGGAVGALLLGLLSAAVESGFLPIAGLGQFSTSGTAVAVVAGGGIGLAFGALAASLIALFHLPKRESTQE
jgi:hypothetical protein